MNYVKLNLALVLILCALPEGQYDLLSLTKNSYLPCSSESILQISFFFFESYFSDYFSCHFKVDLA